jgi:hypothetical protein
MTSYAATDFTPRNESHETLDRGIYDWTFNIAAQVRPNSTCQGAGPASGMTCAQSNLRSTIPVGQGYLYQRSFLSSAGPVIAGITDFPDTLSTPIFLTEAEQRSLNKGTGLLSYQTRVFSDYPSIMETTGPFVRQSSIGTTWRETFAFSPSAGMNTSTRVQQLNDASVKDALTRAQWNSYGNYGAFNLSRPVLC